MALPHKIKVLHISSERVWRGGEQQIAYLIEELNRLGVENLVATKTGSAFEKYCQSQNIRLFSISALGSTDIKSALKIKSICRSQGIDVIHLHSSNSHSIGVLAALLGNRTPMILSRRVDFTLKNSWLTRWKYNHKGIKKILCVSDRINTRIKDYILEPGKSITIHDGIDLDRFSTKSPQNSLRNEFNIHEDTFIIGNTSALTVEKDHVTFIHTIKILLQRNVPVVAFIIGGGPLETELKECVSHLNLNGKVIFTGFRKDIASFLPSLDLFLMTSNQEGLGTSVLDAFAAGVPVVATAAGGVPELVEHQKTGLLAPIGDTEMLARHVEQILHNDHLRKQLTENAAVKVQQFSKEETALKTLHVYEEVINNHL